MGLVTSLALAASSSYAGTVTFDGNGTSATALDTAVNWDTNALPTTNDQAVFTDAGFGGPLPAGLSTGTTPQTWGNVVWDSSSTSVLSASSNAGKITLSGLGGNINNDLITVGATMTSGSLGWSFGSGGAFTTATTGNINVVNAGVTLNMNTQFEFNSLVTNQVITKTGAGTLNFANGNNGNLGAGSGSKFILDGGTLNFSNGNGNMFGGSSATILEIHNGTFLDTNGVAFDVVGSRNFKQTWAGDFTYKGTTGKSLNMGTGAVTMTGGSRQITVNAGTLTVAGIIGDGGNNYSLTKAGAGGLTLSGVNTYGGSTTISGGTLSLGVGADRLATTGEVIIANGTSAGTSGIFNLGGQNQTIAKLSSSVAGAGTTKGTVRNLTNATTATLTVTGTSTFDGIIRDNSGGANTGIVALTKSTGGVLTLTGANTYTGATIISGGTLLVNGSLAAGSAVALNNGGTLGGSGTIAGLVTTQGTTSVISPGNSPGTLTLSGGLDATAGADFVFQLGTSSDLLSLGSGVLTGSSAAAGLVFDFSDSGGLTALTTYTLITFGSSSGLDYTDLFANTLPSGFTLNSGFGTNGFLINGSNLQVQFSSVPEPSTYALLGMGVSALCFLRRKRKV